MISAPEAIISLTSIHRPLSGRLEAHATIKLTMDTQPSAEPTLGSTVSSLDNTVTLKGVVEAHQDIQVKVTVNDTDYTASIDNDISNWHVSVPQSAILSGGESVHHYGHRSRRE